MTRPAVTIGLEGVVGVRLGLVEKDGLLTCFGGAEILGALLFGRLRTAMIGAGLLVCTFLAASVVHLLEYDLSFEHLVAAVAILLVVVQLRREPTPADAIHSR